jgi:hypothetical protein
MWEVETLVHLTGPKRLGQRNDKEYYFRLFSKVALWDGR